MERIRDCVARLAEDWDNVQILVNRHTGEDGLDYVQWGAGNLLARERHAQIFLESGLSTEEPSD